ncbi:hypothetical protein [Streptacidiphilus neutrinimicus]|uniref:hypothetical protein n=1 Tax=Streptacidiphilus neutrinimicus TaxID=105420 RepID=UPI0005AB870C|nr:hypothetical protein [Streptacidiphilus neutrinimicus]
MRPPTMRPGEYPPRLATGAFIRHSGLQKWDADQDTAEGLHGMAVRAYPVLSHLPPDRFVRLLSAAEITTGSALLLPLVPTALAGAALTAFSGALVGLYARTPGLREPGSPWPTERGIGLSKDSWMLGIGVGLLVEALTRAVSADGEADGRAEG